MIDINSVPESLEDATPTPHVADGNVIPASDIGVEQEEEDDAIMSDGTEQTEVTTLEDSDPLTPALIAVRLPAPDSILTG